MANTVRKKMYLGLLIAGGIIFFLVGIFFVGRKEGMYTTSFHVNAIFSDINGIREGDFVRFAGAKVGIVDKITFVNDSMICVSMKIQQDMQKFIMNDGIIYIATEGLVGNKMLNITPQHKSRITAKDGDTLDAVDPFNTQQVIDRLLATNDNAAVITKNLADLSGKMNNNNGLLQSLLSDSNNTADFSLILRNVRSTSDQLLSLSAQFAKLTRQIDQNDGIAGSLFSDTSLANGFSQTMENIRESSNYSALITRSLSDGLNGDSLNTIGVLMHDTAFASSVKQSVKNLQSSSAKLDETMDALQHSIFLRKYFRKQAKGKNN